MKTYYYALDEHKRFIHITEEELNYYEKIDLQEKDFEQIITNYHGLLNGKIVTIGQTEEEKVSFAKQHNQGLIEGYKIMLQETDWKVIVNSELTQAGLPPKYPDLHKERQAWRDEINALER
jgi:hypothetical protein